MVDSYFKFNRLILIIIFITSELVIYSLDANRNLAQEGQKKL
jgi:hypothetical protein